MSRGSSGSKPQKTGATAFTFQELDRAYDALFLYDRSRRVNIEINFRTNKIYYSEGPPTSPELRRHPKSSRPVLYDVLSKSAGLVRAAPGTRRPEDEIYSGFSDFPKQVRYFRRNRLLGLFWNK